MGTDPEASLSSSSGDHVDIPVDPFNETSSAIKKIQPKTLRQLLIGSPRPTKITKTAAITTVRPIDGNIMALPKRVQQLKRLYGRKSNRRSKSSSESPTSQGSNTNRPQNQLTTTTTGIVSEISAILQAAPHFSNIEILSEAGKANFIALATKSNLASNTALQNACRNELKHTANNGDQRPHATFKQLSLVLRTFWAHQRASDDPASIASTTAYLYKLLVPYKRAISGVNPFASQPLLIHLLLSMTSPLGKCSALTSAAISRLNMISPYNIYFINTARRHFGPPKSSFRDLDDTVKHALRILGLPKVAGYIRSSLARRCGVDPANESNGLYFQTAYQVFTSDITADAILNAFSELKILAQKHNHYEAEIFSLESLHSRVEKMIYSVMRHGVIPFIDNGLSKTTSLGIKHALANIDEDMEGFQRDIQELCLSWLDKVEKVTPDALCSFQYVIYSHLAVFKEFIEKFEGLVAALGDQKSTRLRELKWEQLFEYIFFANIDPAKLDMLLSFILDSTTNEDSNRQN